MQLLVMIVPLCPYKKCIFQTTVLYMLIVRILIQRFDFKSSLLRMITCDKYSYQNGQGSNDA